MAHFFPPYIQKYNPKVISVQDSMNLIYIVTIVVKSQGQCHPIVAASFPIYNVTQGHSDIKSISVVRFNQNCVGLCAFRFGSFRDGNRHSRPVKPQPREFCFHSTWTGKTNPAAGQTHSCNCHLNQVVEWS